jgi:hypothetical protein
MSALPPKADIEGVLGNVRFVPKADILRRGKKRRYSITPLQGGNSSRNAQIDGQISDHAQCMFNIRMV